MVRSIFIFWLGSLLNAFFDKYIFSKLMHVLMLWFHSSSILFAVVCIKSVYNYLYKYRISNPLLSTVRKNKTSSREKYQPLSFFFLVSSIRLWLFYFLMSYIYVLPWCVQNVYQTRKSSQSAKKSSIIFISVTCWPRLASRDMIVIENTHKYWAKREEDTIVCGFNYIVYFSWRIFLSKEEDGEDLLSKMRAKA